MIECKDKFVYILMNIHLFLSGLVGIDSFNNVDYAWIKIYLANQKSNIDYIAISLSKKYP